MCNSGGFDRDLFCPGVHTDAALGITMARVVCLWLVPTGMLGKSLDPKLKSKVSMEGQIPQYGH